VSALAEALVAAQADLPCALGKDADGQIQNRTYRHLTLDKLIEATKPILQKHGLAIVQWPSYIARGDEAALPLHHLVSRQDHGDDLADNLVPLCRPCHDAITRRVPTIARLLLSRLSDAEYAYAVQRGGEDYFERAYGVSYER
jgi:hypothetical protein